MQNQRQNGRPDAAVRMAGLFLVLFCVAAVLIPAKTLFTGNGFLRITFISRNRNGCMWRLRFWQS